MDDELAALRVAVDAADAAILEAIGQRAAAVRAIGAWKRAHGVTPLDATREAVLRARWCEIAREHGVSEALAAAVLEALLEAGRAEVSR